MRTNGTIACDRCGTEFHIAGVLHMSIDPDGMLVSELEPDQADVDAMTAHTCQARWEPCPGECGDYAADRKREQQFADEWVRVHRARHDHSDDRRPE